MCKTATNTSNRCCGNHLCCGSPFSHAFAIHFQVYCDTQCPFKPFATFNQPLLAASVQMYVVILMSIERRYYLIPFDKSKMLLIIMGFDSNNSLQFVVEYINHSVISFTNAISWQPTPNKYIRFGAHCRESRRVLDTTYVMSLNVFFRAYRKVSRNCLLNHRPVFNHFNGCNGI